MNRTRELLTHAISWIVLILVLLLLGSKGFNITYSLIVVFVYFGALNIAIFYANYIYILPVFLARKKYRNFLFAIILLILLAGFVKYGLALCFKQYVLIGDMKKAMTFGNYYAHTLLISTFFVFLSSAVHFTVDWFKNEQSRKNFEKEKLTAELSFLKSQINPHFLLNSLNNIYSLAYQRSDKTAEAVLKLSDMMKYMLYESNEMKVEISKEIQYIENFIELQKIRFKDSAFVNLSVAAEGTGQTIVPLLLIPFIENIFKHGVINDPAQPVEINISISLTRISLFVTNKKSNQNKDETGGIGLQNVKRRLELLYPDRYSLNIKDAADSYTCELSLEL